MKTPPDKPYYKTIKTNLKNIVKHQSTIDKINQTVMSAHKIMIHTLHFLKLYLIYYYEKNKSFPAIDKPLVTNIMKTMCRIKKDKRGKPPSKATSDLKDQLKIFFNQHYQSIMKDNDLSYKYMNTVLDYLTVDVITTYETNIKQHFVEYVERYVNVVLEKSQQIEIIKAKNKESKKLVEKLCRELRKVKSDLLDVNNNGLKSDPKYHQWILEQKVKVIPTKKFEKDNLYYDLQCHPQDYLPHMFYMMKTVEAKDETIYNIFPLRSNIIPKHIRLDTTSLVNILITKKYGKKGFYLTKGNLIRHQDRLWKFFFRTEKRCFHNNNNGLYRFNHMIETDGISCSIILIRKDKYGKRFRVPKVKSKSELYIDDLTDFTNLQDKQIVGIDPNMSDLLFCSEIETGKQFRYTQDQRRKETKVKKYQNILLINKNSTKIAGKTIVEWETELSNYNRKTLNFTEFKKYLTKKNQVNYLLMNFYQNYLYRKLKLNKYSNRYRTEDKMINNFIKKFGKPDEVVIGIGDWEQKKHRKYKEPVKGKGFRNLFRKKGFSVYLVDEWGTSSRCYSCHGKCETFRECPNPRPWKDGNIKRHGLLMCKTCSGLWNRDVNSSLNMCRIMKDTIAGLDRPEYLCRPKKEDTEVSVSGATSVDIAICPSTILVGAT